MENSKQVKSLIARFQFFIGLAMGLITLWHTSTKWEKANIEMLFELRELRKENHYIQRDIVKLTNASKASEIHIATFEVRLENLEKKLDAIKTANQK